MSVRGFCLVILFLIFSFLPHEAFSWLDDQRAVTKALDAYESAQELARQGVIISPQPSPKPFRAVKNVQTKSTPEGGQRRHETEMGFEVYNYSYEETVEGEHFMDLKGKFYGLFLKHTFRPYPLNPLWGDLINLVRFEGRFAWAGDLHYNGGVSDGAGFEAPLEMDKVKDFVWELRALAGQEMIWRQVSFTPYFGFGMRFLHDDSTDTTGTFDYYGTTYEINGYKRTSEYYYLPVGVDMAVRFAGGWSLGINGEFDIFLYGHQKSYLDSTDGAVPKNNQNSGYGLRGSLRLAKEPNPVGFSLEPYIRYWDIEDSEPTYIPGYVLTEPSNVTQEIGLKASVIF